MLKRILFPLDGSADSETAGHYVLEIARRYDAFVTAMAVVDRPGIERALRPMGIGVSHLAHDARDWLIRENEREAEAALTGFTKRMAAAGVQNVDVEEYAGPVEAIVTESRFFDLVVMGERAIPSMGDEEDTSTLLEVVQRSAAPVLAVGSPFRNVRHVLVCFDGSAQAAAALTQYARLSPFGKEPATTVLAVTEKGDDDEQMRMNVDRAANYLQAYGHNPFVKHVEGHPGDEIPAFAAANDVDLVVVGAYGRKGLRGFFFGSLTQRLIHDTKVPLFLAH